MRKALSPGARSGQLADALVPGFPEIDPLNGMGQVDAVWWYREEKVDFHYPNLHDFLTQFRLPAVEAGIRKRHGLADAPIRRFPIAIEEDTLSGFLKFDRTVEGHLITSEWKVSSVLLSYNALFAGDQYPQIFPRTLPLSTSARVLSVLWAEGREEDGGRKRPPGK